MPDRGWFVCPHCPQLPREAQYREFVQSLMDLHIRQWHPEQEGSG